MYSREYCAGNLLFKKKQYLYVLRTRGEIEIIGLQKGGRDYRQQTINLFIVALLAKNGSLKFYCAVVVVGAARYKIKFVKYVELIILGMRARGG